MRPGNLQLLIGVLAVLACDAPVRAQASADGCSVSRGGLVIYVGRPVGNDQTIFGLPLGGNPGGVPFQDRVVAQDPDTIVKAPPADLMPPATIVPPDSMNRRLDYMVALRAAPIEMVLPHAIVVDGNTVEINNAFQFDLPLGRFDTKPKAFAGKQEPSPYENTPVRCVFWVISITSNSITVRVIADPRFPALKDVLTMPLAPDTDQVRTANG